MQVAPGADTFLLLFSFAKFLLVLLYIWNFYFTIYFIYGASTFHTNFCSHMKLLAEILQRYVKKYFLFGYSKYLLNTALNMWPNSVPLPDIRLQNLSDLEFTFQGHSKSYVMMLLDSPYMLCVI